MIINRQMGNTIKYIGETNPNSKLSEAQVREIRRLYHEVGVPQIDIAYKYSISTTNVYKIICRKSWKHIK